MDDDWGLAPMTYETSNDIIHTIRTKSIGDDPDFPGNLDSSPTENGQHTLGSVATEKSVAVVL